MGTDHGIRNLRRVLTLVFFAICTLPAAVSSFKSRLDTVLSAGATTNYTLGKCHAFTLKPGQFFLENDDTIRLTNDKDTIIKLQNIALSNEDSVAHVCFPLSEHFQTCSKKAVLAGGYVVLPSQALKELPSGQTWPLGEYDVLPGGSALLCAAAAPPRRRRRCNYLILKPQEYVVQPDGAFWIAVANKTLTNASFTIDIATQAANVCYPLTPQFLNCSKWLLERNEFSINADKSLSDIHRGDILSPGEYVVFRNRKAAVCTTNVLEPDDGFDVYILHAVAQMISAVCLLAAIVVHVLLPDLSYQRAPLLCQAFSLMVTYLCLAARKMHHGLETPGCYAIFYTTYYFCLAAFFWLSVLAYDIWRISVHLRSGTKGYRWVNYFSNKKFLFYALFGWGVPMLFVILLSVVDTYENIQDELRLFPRIESMCWFNERSSAYTFFYGPMCFLLAVNFVFFGLSVHNIWKASHDAEFTNKKLNKQLLVICFIVFLAMGLFWIMEIVSYGTLSHGIIWIVPDLINASQGVIIAAVYTCRPLTIRLLREKFCHQGAGAAAASKQ